MYIYFGWLNLQSYAVNEPMYLVIENGFEFQSPVRVFWRWTKDGDGNAHTFKLCQGTIDRADLASYPTAGSTYGMFYDLYYPFDVFVDDDIDDISVTVYEHPKSDSGCKVVSTLSMHRYASFRTTAPDYDPTLFLPPVRYYSLGRWYDHLWAMIVPDSLCHHGTLWVTGADDKYVYIWLVTMLMDEQDDDTITVEFFFADYEAKFKLNKHDGGWTCLSFTKPSDDDSSSSSDDSSSSSSDDIEAAAKDTGKNMCLMKVSHESKGTHQPASSSSSTHVPSPVPIGLLPKAGVAAQFKHEIHRRHVVDRTVSLVINDTTDQAVYCELSESATDLKASAVAVAGMGLAVVGVMPLGSLSTPVALYGTLLAGFGLYDTLNTPSGPQKRLLLPGERMQRRTSGGVPIHDNNDLSIMVTDISGKSLRYRVGAKTRVGTSAVHVSNLLSESGFLKTMMSIAGSDLDTKKIQACKIVKMLNVIPKYKEGATLESLSTASYYDLSDGQLIYATNSSETIYSVFDGTRSNGDTLFEFGYDCSATLFHEYIATARDHDIVHLPDTNFKLLKIKSARVDIEDQHRNSMAVNMRDEGDVLDKIKKYTSKVFYAYSWSYNSTLFGYTLVDLQRHHGAIKSTSTESDIAYIAVSSWLPWQRIVKK